MTTLHDLMKALISELAIAQAPGFFPEQIDGVLALPSFVSNGHGGSLMLSRAMETSIARISSVLKQNNPVLSRSHTDNEWNQVLRTALGPLLTKIDIAGDPDASADEILVSVRGALAQANRGGVHDHAFGCTLFKDSGIAPFSLGPVRFEPRLDWIARKTEEGDISSVTTRRVIKTWAGHKARQRKRVADRHRESGVLEAIGSCPYVCSVITDGLAHGAGALKAQTAARLALICVALWWPTPSRALDGFNLLIDRAVRQQRSLTFAPGRIVLIGGRLQGRPHGPQISPADWAGILQNNSDAFRTVAEVLEFYLSPTGTVGRPKLMNALAQALLWFHEGCREQVDLIAIVKFAACLDALASGRESAGILRLIKARLGPEPNDPIRTNGQTTKQGVEEIYGKGRSRTIHGTNENFGDDWISTRRFSEEIARHCLISCLGWAATNAIDDPTLLMQ
ncbi:hypothetical protein [Mesorhizobium sp. LNHC209A00]|uniref:hypothetical protein n=1 Tax=Mesorhizobium TaxID=68287 RepID=UPI0003D00F55|nr:hypothetical protein [Mesorhizobium sp. LNHC209A00]ESY94847.1 hypothetical protein X738_23070 [Mesorhizobium sp. LNHC209A00]